MRHIERSARPSTRSKNGDTTSACPALAGIRKSISSNRKSTAPERIYGEIERRPGSRTSQRLQPPGRSPDTKEYSGMRMNNLARLRHGGAAGDRHAAPDIRLARSKVGDRTNRKPAVALPPQRCQARPV